RTVRARPARAMWTTGGRRPEAALQRGLHPDDPPPHPDLLAAAHVQAGARMPPAPVLRLLGELGAGLADLAAPGDGDDLVRVGLRPAPALHGQVATATGIAHVLDLCGERGGGSDQQSPLSAMTCDGAVAA